MKHIPFFLLLLLLTSCSREQKKSQINHLNIDYRSEKKINLSDYVARTHFVQLETNENCIIGNVTKAQLYDQKIFLLDEMTSILYEYDISGQFHKSLNRRGTGPEEYIQLKDFVVAEDGVYVLDFSSQTIFLYDFNFNYKEKYRYNSFASSFTLLDDAFLLYNEISMKDDDYQFTQIDKDGKILSEYLPRNMNSEPSFYWASSNVFSKDKDSIYFSSRYSNTIYCKTEGSLHEAFYLDFGSKTIPKQKSYLNYNIYDLEFPYILREKFYVSDNFLIVDFFNKGKRMFTFFDKQNSIIQTGYVNNDLISGFDCFYPQWISENCLIEVVNAYDILNEFSIITTDMDISNLRVDDNPVILLYYLK